MIIDIGPHLQWLLAVLAIVGAYMYRCTVIAKREIQIANLKVFDQPPPPIEKKNNYHSEAEDMYL